MICILLSTFIIGIYRVTPILSFRLFATARNINAPAEILAWSLPLTTDAFTQTTPFTCITLAWEPQSPRSLQGQLKPFQFCKAFHGRSSRHNFSPPIQTQSTGCQLAALAMVYCLVTALPLLFDLCGVFSG